LAPDTTAPDRSCAECGRDGLVIRYAVFEPRSHVDLVEGIEALALGHKPQAEKVMLCAGCWVARRRQERIA